MTAPQLECFDCMTAATSEWHGFTNPCKGCAARAAARSQHFARVRQAGTLRGDWAYRALLEQFNLTHEEVKAAHASDALGKSRAALG